MAPVTEHQKASRLIQLKLDGVLEVEQAVWLERHLHACGECRRLSAQLMQLDEALRADFSAQRAATPAHPARSLPAHAFDPIQKLSRANMNTKLRSFANTLVSIVLLAALTGGLAWVLSTQIPPAGIPAGGPASNATFMPSPGAEDTPAPRLTAPSIQTAVSSAAPLPTPTPVPLPSINNTAEIVDTLMKLANAEMAQSEGAGWAHSTVQSISENGTGVLPGAFVEYWTRFEQKVCVEGYVVVKDRSDDAEPKQLIVSLSDGLAGDLMALRRGAQPPAGELPGSLPCPAGPEITDAGRLAQRLIPSGSQPLSPELSNLQEVHARYENADTQPVLVVEAIFTQSGNAPEVQRETRRFDVGSGKMLQEHIWVEWASGAPIGEKSTELRTEIVPALPPEVAEFYTEITVELRTYFDPATGELLRPTATPLPTSAEVPFGATPLPAGGLSPSEQIELLNRFQYSLDDPLTDLAEIIRTMEALHQRTISWLSQPGWRLYTPKAVETLASDISYSELLHTLPDGTCDWFSFHYSPDGAIQASQIYRGNGDWGLIGNSLDGKMTEGEARTTPCRLDSFLPVTIFKNRIWTLNEIQTGALQGVAHMWRDERDGLPVLVLQTALTYADSKPSILDPDTHKQEPAAGSYNWAYFDFETGASVGEDNRYDLENGKAIGGWYQPGGPATYEAIDYDTLPGQLAQAFEEMVRKLEAYLAGK